MTKEEVLSIRTVDELVKFRPHDFCWQRGLISPEEVQHIFELCGAFWKYPGKPSPEYPHVELTSDLCSNRYIDCSKVLCYPSLCQILAIQAMWVSRVKYTGSIDWVVSSSYAAMPFGQALAEALQEDIFPMIRWGYAEKGKNKEQSWERWEISPNEIVLQAEELMTTSETTLAVRRGIREGNPNPVQFAPVISVLIHRSDVYTIEESEIICLAHFDIQNWKPEQCPFCAAGSKRLQPKSNWSELTGKE